MDSRRTDACDVEHFNGIRRTFLHETCWLGCVVGSLQIHLWAAKTSTLSLDFCLILYNKIHFRYYHVGPSTLCFFHLFYSITEPISKVSYSWKRFYLKVQTSITNFNLTTSGREISFELKSMRFVTPRLRFSYYLNFYYKLIINYKNKNYSDPTQVQAIK